MGFFSKRFSKGTIIDKTDSYHIDTRKHLIRKHYGVVEKTDGEWTIFSIFSSSNKYKTVNKPINKSKFTTDFAEKVFHKPTYISEPVFKKESKKLKRYKSGGKYNE